MVTAVVYSDFCRDLESYLHRASGDSDMLLVAN